MATYGTVYANDYGRVKIKRTRVERVNFNVIVTCMLLATIFFLIGLLVGKQISVKHINEPSIVTISESNSKSVTCKVNQMEKKINTEKEFANADKELKVLEETNFNSNNSINVNTKCILEQVHAKEELFKEENFKVYDIKLSEDLQRYAYDLCMEYNLEYELFLAMMFKESSYRPDVVGGGSSYGLCQIHKVNHNSLKKKLGINDFFDPYDNMKAGAYMLSDLFEKGEKLSSDPEIIKLYVLNSYNMGETGYKNFCSTRGSNIERDYSTKILKYRDQLLEEGTIG